MRGFSNSVLVLLFTLGLTQAQQSPKALAAAARSGNKSALQQLSGLANAGNVVAQNALGDLYYRGEGVPQDLGTAVLWYRKAADRGMPVAQFNLGWVYANGEGVPEDSANAFQWYRKAAAQGLSEAQYALGWMYENGVGVAEDVANAAQWYRKAAEQGNPDAEFNMGIMYCNGEGVSRDREKAFQWYRKAAEHGNTDARDEIKNPAACKEPNTVEINLHKQGGVLLAPVLINGRISLDFIVDSGASDVSLPADVVLTLIRTGTLTAADFTGSKSYVLANGSQIPSQTLRIRSLKIGDFVLNNVAGSVAPPDGSPLLGQSFLGRVKSWSVDNVRLILALESISVSGNH
jgi:clan AA aspartic protease (TIGR02281 family)